MSQQSRISMSMLRFCEVKMCNVNSNINYVWLKNCSGQVSIQPLTVLWPTGFNGWVPCPKLIAACFRLGMMIFVSILRSSNQMPPPPPWAQCYRKVYLRYFRLMIELKFFFVFCIFLLKLTSVKKTAKQPFGQTS